MLRTLLCAGFSLGCLLALPTNAELVLVENGESRMPIVIFADAPHYTRLAAQALADDIKSTTGARPEVIEGTPNPLPETAIWVGVQPVLANLFPDLDFDFQHPEEILIAANDRHLVIAGRDVWDPDNTTAKAASGREIIGIQHEYGTANAVYTFLHDFLGVRRFRPGELGEDFLETPTLSLAPFTFRYHPRWRYRSGLFNIMARQHRLRRGGGADWLRFQRLALDSLDMNAGGHGFSGWWNRFHENHPDYFALQPDGSRSGFPNPGNAKICHANPAVAEQWMALVAEQLELNPHQRVFNASPNDSGSSGHCICEACRAWDHPDAEQLNFTWRGLVQPYAAISDRQVTFANRVARKLREAYPDRDFFVSLMAHLTWNPDTDGRAVLDDYHQRAYGHAADLLKTYWTMMETARNRKVDDYPGENNGYAEVYNEAFFAQTYALLDQAAAAVASSPTRFGERVAFTRVGLDYTRLVAELREGFERYRDTGAQDQGLERKLCDQWAEIRRMDEAHPDALNWRLIQPGTRPMRRAGGLHPDTLR